MRRRKLQTVVCFYSIIITVTVFSDSRASSDNNIGFQKRRLCPVTWSWSWSWSLCGGGISGANSSKILFWLQLGLVDGAHFSCISLCLFPFSPIVCSVARKTFNSWQCETKVGVWLGQADRPGSDSFWISAYFCRRPTFFCPLPECSCIQQILRYPHSQSDAMPSRYSVTRTPSHLDGGKLMTFCTSLCDSARPFDTLKWGTQPRSGGKCGKSARYRLAFCGLPVPPGDVQLAFPRRGFDDTLSLTLLPPWLKVGFARIKWWPADGSESDMELIELLEYVSVMDWRIIWAFLFGENSIKVRHIFRKTNKSSFGSEK